MSKKLSGGATVVVLIAVIVGILYYGYKNFLAEPAPISPEETRKMMGGGGGGGGGPMAQTQQVPTDAGKKESGEKSDGKGDAKEAQPK